MTIESLRYEYPLVYRDLEEAAQGQKLTAFLAAHLLEQFAKKQNSPSFYVIAVQLAEVECQRLKKLS